MRRFRLAYRESRKLGYFPTGKVKWGGGFGARQAQESLDEIRARERQIADTATRYGSPWWYVSGIGAVFLGVSVCLDVRDLLDPGWLHRTLGYASPLVGLALVGLLARGLHRAMGFRAQNPPARMNRYLAGLAIGVLVVDIAVGTVLRLDDVAWDSTLSGAAGTLVLIVGYRAMRWLAPEPSPASR